MNDRETSNGGDPLSDGEISYGGDPLNDGEISYGGDPLNDGETSNGGDPLNDGEISHGGDPLNDGEISYTAEMSVSNHSATRIMKTNISCVWQWVGIDGPCTLFLLGYMVMRHQPNVVVVVVIVGNSSSGADLHRSQSEANPIKWNSFPT